MKFGDVGWEANNVLVMFLVQYHDGMPPLQMDDGYVLDCDGAIGGIVLTRADDEDLWSLWPYASRALVTEWRPNNDG